jgi:cold shock CspA family protein
MPLTGTVKWFDNKKGIGFITQANGGEDVFVHQSEIHAEGFRSLGEGEDVEFAIEKDEQSRDRAVRVTGPDGAHVKGAPRRSPGKGRGKGKGKGDAEAAA